MKKIFSLQPKAFWFFALLQSLFTLQARTYGLTLQAVEDKRSIYQSSQEAVQNFDRADKSDLPSQELVLHNSMEQALRKLRLPGVRLNIEERTVDVEAEVCLHEGLLELVACTEDSKEHESIIVLKARPLHVHTALLLFGARPGSPAMRKVTDGEGGERLVPVQPAGDAVEVLLVFPNQDGKPQEHSVSRFVAPANLLDFDGPPLPDAGKKPFPSKFIFAGSHLVEDGPGPRKYVCEGSGNVISISTFGDELLCLPGIHGHDNDGLAWKVNPKGLPAVGEPVILRLRPLKKPVRP